MAVAVDFRVYQPADSREDLLRKVQAAPAEHAEAILAAYEVLEKLHEKDVLNLLNGLLGAKDTVVDHVTDLISSREMVNVLRLALIAGNVIKQIDPDDLNAVLRQSEGKAPSQWQVIRRLMSADARRAMGTLAGVMNVFGAALGKRVR